MSSQRINRGFHRLALFLAAISLLIGTFAALLLAPDWTAPFSSPKWSVRGRSLEHHRRLTTIQIEGIGEIDVSPFDKMPFGEMDQAQQQSTVDKIVTNYWRSKVAIPFLQGFGITIAISLAVYGIVRAIGWVIGGSAAS